MDATMKDQRTRRSLPQQQPGTDQTRTDRGCSTSQEHHRGEAEEERALSDTTRAPDDVEIIEPADKRTQDSD